MRLMCGLLLLGLAAAPAFAAQPVVGAWYGTGQPNDRSEMYFDRVLADGTINTHHRYCRKGKALDIFETGNWSVAGNILTIGIVTVNGLFKPRVDTYKITSVDAKSWNYIFIPLNFAFKAKRVADKFEMPACDVMS